MHLNDRLFSPLHQKCHVARSKRHNNDAGYRQLVAGHSRVQSLWPGLVVELKRLRRGDRGQLRNSRNLALSQPFGVPHQQGQTVNVLLGILLVCLLHSTYRRVAYSDRQIHRDRHSDPGASILFRERSFHGA